MKKQKYKIHITIISMIATIVAVIYLSSTTMIHEEKTFKIGAIVPLSGSLAYWGVDARRGIELAIQDINDPKFQVVYEDTQSQITGAVTSTQKLISTNNVDMVYSHFSGVSSAVSPTTHDNNKILYYSAFSSTPLQENNLSYKGFIEFKTPCEEYSIYAKNHNITKIALVSEFGDTYVYCIQGLKKNYADENIYAVTNLNLDFKTLLLKLYDEGYDGLIVLTYEPNSINLFRQIKELDIDFKSIFCEQNDCYGPKVQQEIGFMPRLVYFDPEIKESFKNKVEAHYNVTDSARLTPIAFSYDDMMRIYEASKQCDTQDNECMMTALSNINNSEVFSEIINDGRTYHQRINYVLVNNDGTEKGVDPNVD